MNALSFFPPAFTSPTRKYVAVALCQVRVARLAELRTTLVNAPLLFTFARIPSRTPTSFLPLRLSLLDPYICALPSGFRIIDVSALFAVPIVLAVENFPLSVAEIRTVPAPRSPRIEIPLVECEIAVISIGDVALSE